jgi:WD40 repeat protein
MDQERLHLSDVTNYFEKINTYIPKPSSEDTICSYAIAKNRSFIVAGYCGLVYLWNTFTGELISILAGHNLHVNFCRFFRNDTRIVTGDADELRVWETETNEYSCVRVKPVDGLTNVAVSAENTLIIYTTRFDFEIQIYDSATDQNIRTLPGHAVSPPRPDTNIIAIDNHQIFGSMDYFGEIKLWNISTGKCTKTIPRPNCHPIKDIIRYTSSKWLVWSYYAQDSYCVRVLDLEKDTYIDIQGGEYILFVDVRYVMDLIIASYKERNADHILENLHMEIYSLETGKLKIENKK